MEKLAIGVIIGSTREGRFSEYPAHWVTALGSTRDDMKLEIVDLRDYALPFLEGAVNPSHLHGVYQHAEVVRFAEKIKGCDGYVIVTPEYNHSTSGVLKNALDCIYGEFTNKPVAFISYGSVGGARAVEQLRAIAIEHQMAPTRNAVHIMAPWMLREADGSLKTGALDVYTKSAESMLEQLAWWTKVLTAARNAS